jgi:hypothetical protein
MEAADVLYGVTMQAGSGVSKVVARRPVGKRSAVFQQQKLTSDDVAKANAEAAETSVADVEAVTEVDEPTPV